MAEAEDREGFLARWSRRKRAAREGIEPPGPAPTEPVPVLPEPAAAPEPEETIDLSTLPKLEDLTPTSDITAFLRKGVPLALRNAALRRMWSLDPAIRDYIGPVDYGWDWNTPGGAPDYVAEIGETPEIRDLVARMLSPSPPQAEPERLSEEEAARPERLAAEPVPTVMESPAATIANAKPAVADEAPSPDPLPPPPRPRHGGAMPS